MIINKIFILMNYLDLINVMLLKDLDILWEVINCVNKYNYNMVLMVQILLVNCLLERYIWMKKIEIMVIDMNQNVVIEMKKYIQFFNGVYQILGVIFLFLGEGVIVVKVIDLLFNIFFSFVD